MFQPPRVFTGAKPNILTRKAVYRHFVYAGGGTTPRDRIFCLCRGGSHPSEPDILTVNWLYGYSVHAPLETDIFHAAYQPLMCGHFIYKGRLWKLYPCEEAPGMDILCMPRAQNARSVESVV